MKIRMGDRVTDIVTGFEGIVVAKNKYINGCVQFCVDPGVDKDGKLMDAKYIDEGQIEVIERNAVKSTRKAISMSSASGGPSMYEPQQ